jgi:hypothetical protein
VEPPSTHGTSECLHNNFKVLIAFYELIFLPKNVLNPNMNMRMI